MNSGRLSRSVWIESLLQSYEQALIRYAAGITGDLERARDVVQDTFLRLCAAKRSRVEKHMPAWLYRVTRNRALDIRKKEGRMEPLLREQLERQRSELAGPDALASRNEMHVFVLEALATLTAEQREACRLKFNDELSYREIAAVMGISLGTVSNLLTAALTTIRQKIRAGIETAREA